MSTPDLPYRPCVGIALLNADSKVFVGQRKGGPEQANNLYSWQMPQGAIDDGEEPLDAVKRELWEETNIRSASLVAEYPDWLSYDLPAELIGKAWKGKYRGQRQKWFVLRFTGKESEINVTHPGDGKHKPEFVAWKWIDAKELPAIIVPFKKPIYEKISAFLLRHSQAA